MCCVSQDLTDCWSNEQSFLVAVRALRDGRPSSVCDIIAWYVACFGSYSALVILHRGTLKICLFGVQLSTSTCFFLQWNLVTFPQKLGEGTCGDKSGPMENMHPVSKGWICVEWTENCLTLKNHSQRFRCLLFRRLGESQSLYKGSVLWEFVCVWSEFTPLIH